MILVETRRNGQLTGAVPDWQRLTWREQANTVTGGTITLPQSSPAVAELLTASTTTDMVGIVISDDELVNDVGVWHLPAYVVEENLTATGDTITVPFRLDTGLLNDNPAFPAPTTPTDPYGTVAYWSHTGAVETVVGQFVNEQAGTAATANWQRFGAVTTSTGVLTGSATIKARMQPCLDVIAGVAAGRCVVTARLASGVMLCHIRGVLDRPNVVFSRELGTLTDFTWKNTMPPATDYFAGGTGTGTGRDLAIATLDTPLWPRRRGLFIDRGDSTGTDLQAAADQAAVWDGPSLVLVGTDATGIRFWVDWQLGDLVRADVAGTRYTLPATAIETEATPGVLTRKVTLGAPRLDGRDAVAVRRSIITTYGLQENP